MKNLRIPCIFLLILFFSVSPSVVFSMTADQYQDQFQMGKSYFDSGHFEKAYETFYPLFEENPKDPAVNFMLGRAAYEFGDYETAVMIFDRMLITNPDSHRVRLEFARCFMKLGSYETAKVHFNRVLASNPPENVKKNIQRYIEQADSALKKYSFSGLLQIFGGWDDNPRVLPNDRFVDIPTIPGLTAILDDQEEDWFMGSYFKLNHRYVPDRYPFLWDSSVLSYNTYYDTQSTESFAYFSFDTGPLINKERSSIRPALVFSHMDKNYETYLDSGGINLSFNYTVSPNLMCLTDIKVECRNFEDNGRDSIGGSIRIQPVLKKNNIIYCLGVVYEMEDADSSEYDLHRFELIPGFKINFTKDIAFNTTAKYCYSDYKGTYSLFDETREDHLFNVSAGISKKVWDALSGKTRTYLGLDYSYTDVSSSIDLYEYSQNRIFLSCILEF